MAGQKLSKNYARKNSDRRIRDNWVGNRLNNTFRKIKNGIIFDFPALGVLLPE
jgi:hypothetical protein